MYTSYYSASSQSVKYEKRNSSKQMKWKPFYVSKINDEIIARKLTFIFSIPSLACLLRYVFHHLKIDQKRHRVLELFMLKWEHLSHGMVTSNKIIRKFRHSFQVFHFWILRQNPVRQTDFFLRPHNQSQFSW